MVSEDLKKPYAKDNAINVITKLVPSFLTSGDPSKVPSSVSSACEPGRYKNTQV
jgi:hypothetical protein